jgi:integrase
LTRERQRAAEISMHVLSILGGNASFTALTPRAIVQVQRAIVERGRSPTTANTIVFGALRAMLRDAEIEGIVPPGFRTELYAPLRRLRTQPSDDRTPVSTKDRDLILAEFRLRLPCFVPFVMAAFGTGARPGELCGLQWRDVDLARHWLRIARSRGEGGVTPGKTVHSRREIRLTRLAMTGLAKLAASPGAADDYVFRSERGAPLDLHNFSHRAWPRVLGELAGRVAYRPFYATRHTFIIAPLMAGKSPAEVAAYCGNSIEVIQRHYWRFIGTPGEGWDEVAAPSAPSSLDRPRQARR